MGPIRRRQPLHKFAVGKGISKFIRESVRQTGQREGFYAKMKTRLITIVCVLSVLFGTLTPSMASQDDVALDTVADVLVVRPGCFVATVLGSALFIVALPVALPSRSVKKTANILVVRPAKATFTRPLGDLDVLRD